MATIERPVITPRESGPQAPQLARPAIKPPKPFFLRSWFALVLTIAFVAAHIYGWQRSGIDLVLLAQKLPNVGRFVSAIAQPDIIFYDQQYIQITDLKVNGLTLSTDAVSCTL